MIKILYIQICPVNIDGRAMHELIIRYDGAENDIYLCNSLDSALNVIDNARRRVGYHNEKELKKPLS